MRKHGLIGRDDKIIENIAKQAHKALRVHHGYTRLRRVRRGYSFDLAVCDRDGNLTGHVATVTVTLDRINQ